MTYLLNIETATTVCSVALSQNGTLLAYKELDEGFTHAENLHLFIETILKEAGISIKQLDAIAVSKGPGSYTGLRIGVSAAKGLAYALGIPLISVGTLEIMACSALSLKNEKVFYCPMIDARRMEVYTAVYDGELNLEMPVEALIVDEISIKKLGAYSGIYFFGNGMPKCKDQLKLLNNAGFIDGVVPSAKDMCALTYKKYSAKQFEDLAYFEPFYLKDFLITFKKK